MSDLWESAIGQPEIGNLENTRSPWAPQQPFLLQGFNNALNLLNQGANLGPQNAASIRAQQLLGDNTNTPTQVDLAGNPMQQRFTNSAGPMSTQAKTHLSATIAGNYLDPSSNPYLAGAVNQALGQTQSQLTGLYGGNAGANLGNSGFQEQLASTLGNVATQAYSGAYQQERQNQLNATQQVQGLEGLDLAYNQANNAAVAGNNASSLAATQANNAARVAAGNLDLDEIEGLMESGRLADQWRTQQNLEPWRNMMMYMQGVGGQYGGQGTQQFPWNNQMFQQMFGGGGGTPGQTFGGQGGFGQTVGAIGSMFSDARLKENIERVGTMEDSGLGIYRYNYIGDDTSQIGVLAQEVEQVKPEAVQEVGGLLTVNYKMI